MKRTQAFSYIRMSTDAQLQGHSLDRQLDLTRAYAKEKGYDLIEDFQDIGLSAHSGKNVKSGQLGHFMKAVAEGKINGNSSVLIVESLDRLSRKNPMDAFSQLTGMLEYGLEIHTIFDRQIYSKESMNETPGQIFSSIGFMLRAHSESEEKSKRLKKKWESKRQNLDKKILTTICPAWLQPNNDRSEFIIKNGAENTIKKIFDLCIEFNMGTYAITRYLNDNLVQYPRFTRPTKNGGPAGWYKSYVTKILHNPAVFGQFTPKTLVAGKPKSTEIDYKNYYPSVITEDRYMLAQSKLNSRKIEGGGRKGITFSNLFTKLIFCDACKAPLHFTNKGAKPKGGRYLQCYNAHSKYICTAPAWRYEEFEEGFFTFIDEIDLLDVLSGGLTKSALETLLNEQASISQRLQKTQEKIEVTFDMIGDVSRGAGHLIGKRLEKLAAEIDGLEARKEEVLREISLLKSNNPKNITDDVYRLIQDNNKTMDADENTAVRRKLNSRLSTIIEKIMVVNKFEEVKPWEINETISEHTLKEFEKLGYADRLSLEHLFNTAKGQQLYNVIERRFVVHFKNGQYKTVVPYRQKFWTLDNSSMKNMVERVKAKKEALELASIVSKRNVTKHVRTTEGG